MNNIIWYHIGVEDTCQTTDPLPPLPLIGRKALVVAEGRAPVWRYALAFHALHGRAGAIGTYDPRLGVVIVASHISEYHDGQILDLEPPPDEQAAS